MRDRQIKFRAWDKGHNKMSYKVNLYSMNNRGEMDRAQIDMKQAMNTIGFDCEIMQFTGLKDKNGKDIYEGDLMRLEDNSFFGVVAMIDGCFTFENLGGSPPLNKKIKEGYVVIGNKFETPIPTEGTK